MRALTFFNHAGGAMKTSLTRDVGFTFASWGLRVLLVDLDPQASLSDWLGVREAPRERTVFGVAVNDDPLPEPYEVHGLHLVPSNVNLAVAEAQMLGKFGAHLHLRERLLELSDRYDVVLIDSPPSLGQLAVLGAIAADALVVPVPTRHKGLTGLIGLHEVLRSYRKVRADLSVALYVPTLYNARRRHDQEALEEMRRLLRPLASPIPDRGAVWNDSSAQGEPVGVYAPGSDVHQDVLRVSAEVARAAGIEVPEGAAGGR